MIDEVKLWKHGPYIHKIFYDSHVRRQKAVAGCIKTSMYFVLSSVVEYMDEVLLHPYTHGLDLHCVSGFRALAAHYREFSLCQALVFAYFALGFRIISIIFRC